MSTTINVTVGGNGLLDRSRQQMQANRFGKLERDQDQKTAAAASTQVAGNADLPLGTMPSPRRLTPEPAANRRSSEGVWWSFSEEGGYVTTGMTPLPDAEGFRSYGSWNARRLLGDAYSSTAIAYEDVTGSPFTVVRGTVSNPYTSIRHDWDKGVHCGGANSFDYTYGSARLSVKVKDPEQISYVRLKLTGSGTIYTRVRAIGYGPNFPNSSNTYVLGGEGPEDPPDVFGSMCRSDGPFAWTKSNASNMQDIISGTDGTGSAIYTVRFIGGSSIDFQFDNIGVGTTSTSTVTIETSWAKTIDGLTDFT